MKEQGLVVRAIDVGFGNVKFTKGLDPEKGGIECDMFPSLAPTASSLLLDGFMSQRRTVVVEVGGLKFEVGPDSMLAMTTNVARNMDIDFPLSDQYMALNLGAMHYMNVDQIDLLVVGLPVSSIGNLGAKVRARLMGEHAIKDRKVTVRDVMVIPQPVGGMWDYAVRHRAVDQFRESTCLLVDPGWFTLDWLVTKDLKVVPGRSDAANNAGMGAVVKSIAESLARRISERDGRSCQITEHIIQRVDRALYGNKIAKINGKDEQVDLHMDAAHNLMRDGMQKLMSSIGSRSDIDNVIVVGGAAPLYAPIVCEVFGPEMVRVSQNPVFANVRGFQVVGMQRAKSMTAA